MTKPPALPVPLLSHKLVFIEAVGTVSPKILLDPIVILDGLSSLDKPLSLEE